jgi:hypothetical protein
MEAAGLFPLLDVNGNFHYIPTSKNRKRGVVRETSPKELFILKIKWKRWKEMRQFATVFPRSSTLFEACARKG